MNKIKLVVLLLLIVITIGTLGFVNYQFYKAESIEQKIQENFSNSKLLSELLPDNYILLDNQKIYSECSVDNQRKINCYIVGIHIANKATDIKYKFNVNIYDVGTINNLSSIDGLKINFKLSDFKSYSDTKEELSFNNSNIVLNIDNKSNFNIDVTIHRLKVLDKDIGNLTFNIENKDDLKKMEYISSLFRITALNFKSVSLEDIEISKIISDIMFSSKTLQLEYNDNFKSILSLYSVDEKIIKLFNEKEKFNSMIEGYYSDYKTSELFNKIRLEEKDYLKLNQWLIDYKNTKKIRIDMSSEAGIKRIKISL